MGKINSSPGHIFLLGREVGLDGDVLSIHDPALRVLTLDHLPCGVELGVAFALLESTRDEGSNHVVLEIVRPSGTAALSMNGTIDRTPSGHTGVWARTLHVVIDETGEWTVSARTAEVRAVRMVDVTLNAAE